MIASHSLRALSSLPKPRHLLNNVAALSLGTGRSYSDDASKKEISPTVTTKQSSSGTSSEGRMGLIDHRVGKLDKFILVWGGRYKTVAEVPDRVSLDALELARNKARIKINIMMCVATVFGCIAMVYSGKKAREAGESVVKMNQDWHKKMKEESTLAKKSADSV